MPELADIFRAASPDYLAKYGERMLPSHKRAIADILLCRTRALGGKTYFCNSCDVYRYSYHSCKNRSCPKCGNDDATRWIAAQNALLLPVPYFLVTVTLPAELRPLARKNQKLVYSLALKTAAKAIQKLARDPKWLGGEVGIIGVLQTWARDMTYHVHIHFIVTGGGMSPEGKWLPARYGDYLMPQQALADVFRGKFRDALKKINSEKLFAQVPKQVWQTQWVADIEPVGKGRSAIKYLAPYIFRVAISNKRICRFQDGRVTFTWKDNKGVRHAATLTAEKFMSRFLQHVLPRGLVKVRYYGLFSTRKRDQLETIKKLFGCVPEENDNGSSGQAVADVRVIKCPKCGTPMVFIGEIKPERNRSP